MTLAFRSQDSRVSNSNLPRVTTNYTYYVHTLNKDSECLTGSFYQEITRCSAENGGLK